MKNILMKATFFISYMFLLLWVVDFNLSLFIDVKAFFIIALGSTLLTLLGYKRGDNRKKVIEMIKWNLKLTGFLTTFMMQVAFLSDRDNHAHSDFIIQICLNFLPLVYAFTAYFVLDAVTLGYMEGNPSQSHERTSVDGQNPSAVYDKYQLTRTERLVAEKVLIGLSNKEISSQMFISESTVKKHLQNMFRKTKTKSRSQFASLLSGNFSKSSGME